MSELYQFIWQTENHTLILGVEGRIVWSGVHRNLGAGRIELLSRQVAIIPEPFTTHEAAERFAEGYRHELLNSEGMDEDSITQKITDLRDNIADLRKLFGEVKEVMQ